MIIGTLISILSLLISLCLFKFYDLSTIFSFIPKNNISINLSLYNIIVSSVLNIAKSKYDNSKSEISIIIAESKNFHSDDNYTISLPDNTTKTIYLVITCLKNLHAFKDKELSITFPKGITVYPEDYTNIEKQLENILVFSISDELTTLGTKRIPLSITNSSKVDQKQMINFEIKQSRFEQIKTSIISNKVSIMTC